MTPASPQRCLQFVRDALRPRASFEHVPTSLPGSYFPILHSLLYIYPSPVLTLAPQFRFGGVGVAVLVRMATFTSPVPFPWFLGAIFPHPLYWFLFLFHFSATTVFPPFHLFFLLQRVDSAFTKNQETSFLTGSSFRQIIPIKQSLLI